MIVIALYPIWHVKSEDPKPKIHHQIALHSWGNIGGCGAGGGSGNGIGGCAKWVGRGVTGGLVDLQSQACSNLTHGNALNTFNTRIGTSALFNRWNFGVNIPILLKHGDVSVPTNTLGVFNKESATISGFGDLSLEIIRKLGITNAHSIMLSTNFPTGSSNAIRQGVFLPPQLQLGSGTLGIGAQYEYTMDRDWGLIILGTNLTYNGWQNNYGGYRASTLGGYAHLGYIIGPFVASSGLTLLAKAEHDREHDPATDKDSDTSIDRSDDSDPLFLFSPNLSLEWSSDLIAFMLSAAPSFSYNGYEGMSVSLGIQSSIF